MRAASFSVLYIVRSLDILSAKEYNYIYEKGVMVRSNERNVTEAGKTVISTVFYTYDKDGKLVKKRVMSADGEVRTLNFEKSRRRQCGSSF